LRIIYRPDGVYVAKILSSSSIAVYPYGPELDVKDSLVIKKTMEMCPFTTQRDY
jgi:hypothetical protein